jgi:hypothetical protein
MARRCHPLRKDRRLFPRHSLPRSNSRLDQDRTVLSLPWMGLMEDLAYHAYQVGQSGHARPCGLTQLKMPDDLIHKIEMGTVTSDAKASPCRL